MCTRSRLGRTSFTRARARIGTRRNGVYTARTPYSFHDIAYPRGIFNYDRQYTSYEIAARLKPSASIKRSTRTRAVRCTYNDRVPRAAWPRAAKPENERARPPMSMLTTLYLQLPVVNEIVKIDESIHFPLVMPHYVDFHVIYRDCAAKISDNQVETKRCFRVIVV